MLQRLHLRNFTVFENAEFSFGKGLNVLVGANGTGKSHVLKVGYALESAYAAVVRGRNLPSEGDLSELGISFGFGISSRLGDVFLPRGLSNLVRRSLDPLAQAEVHVDYGPNSIGSLEFTIGSASPPRSKLIVRKAPTVLDAEFERPVFIPAKEMLSLMPDIIGLSDKYSDFIDATYTGLARLMLIPLLKELPRGSVSIVRRLETLLSGAVEAENGRFYLVPDVGGRFEIGMIAEGYRKLGTLAYLLANGTLTPDTTLFWDEPEANLNPALLRELAAVLAQLARVGFQIILATHSLFLLKELHILARQEATPVRYFGLSARPGEATTVATANDLELLPDIVALDAELEQSDRFQQVLDQGDADRH